MARPHDRPRAAAAPPDATPVVRKSRAEAIASLLANGLTLAEIQEEEERAAALNAIARVRARYWRNPDHEPVKRAGASATAPDPTPPPDPAPPADPPATRYRLRNWRAYTQALKQRASLTLWVDEAAIAQWYGNTRPGQVGHPTVYSHLAIQTVLTLKTVFRLPLRQVEGFARSLFDLLGLPLVVPEYSTLSRRGRTLPVALLRQTRTGGMHVVIDSTGLKVFGEGEWKTRQHGVSKRRTWRKLHLAIDESTGEIVAAVTTERSVGDCEMLPTLVAAIPDPIQQVSADGAYDTIACHQAIAEREAVPAIPPRSTAVIADTGEWDARDAAVERIAAVGMAQWKVEMGYHRRSLAETTMFRLKTVFGDRLSSRQLERQQVEGRLRCAALNRMTSLGMPDSYAVSIG